MNSLLSSNVLVLNQNYEPLSVCTVRRAVVMLFLGKAEAIENHDGKRIRSVSTSFRVPSIVRLGAYARVPRKKVILTRKNIIKRDNGQCMYCGTFDGSMTVDHVVPKRYAGADTWENLVCACLKCNNKKGNRTPEQAGMKLLRKPRRPNHIMFIQRFVGVSDKRWKPYLFLGEN
jgi:5-methylcytosine-specific restriction endonuclease McrA